MKEQKEQYAVVFVPAFPLQAALRNAPEAWDGPVALVDMSPGRGVPRVEYCTEEAMRRGVEIGLTPTQALARCSEIQIRHRVPSLDVAARDAMIQAAMAFSPNIEETTLGTLTLDLRGLVALSGTASRGHAESRSVGEREKEREKALELESEMEVVRDRAWAGLLRDAVMALGFRRVRVGIAPTPTLACHAAVHAAVGDVDEVFRVGSDPERMSAFVSALPVMALGPSSDVTGILRGWGIGTVGELLALGSSALAERLGLEALALLAAASTRHVRPLNCVRPVGRFREVHHYETPVETLEPILFLLRRMVDLLEGRLTLGQWAAAEMVLQLRLDSGEVRSQRLLVPEPTARAETLFRMLHTHLESVRTESPVVEVELEAFPTRVIPRQLSLFEASLKDPHQFQETLARLAALVGADRVGTPVLEAGHRPDAFRLIPPDFENVPLMKDEKESELDRKTPMRRVRPSLPVRVEVTSSGVPRRLEVRGRSASVVVPSGVLRRVEGPWRLSGRWWEGSGWREDSWLVEIRDGVCVTLGWDGHEWRVNAIAD